VKQNTNEGLRILVLEKRGLTEGLLQSIRGSLQIADAQFVGSVENAWHAYRAGRHDLIVAEWATDLDSRSLIRLVRNHKDSPNRLTPIILAMADQSEEENFLDQDEGPMDFLPDSFTADQLAQSIGSVLDRVRRGVAASVKGQDRRGAASPMTEKERRARANERRAKLRSGTPEEIVFLLGV